MDISKELHFVKYHFSRIKDGLTGRGLHTILGEGPRERFHAGVLLPLEPAVGTDQTLQSPDSLNAFEMSHDGVASNGGRNVGRMVNVDSPSAMAMDFQVRLPEGSEHVVLRVQPRLSIWYPVLPSRADVKASLQNNQSDDIGKEDDENPRVAQASVDVDPADQETEPNIGIESAEEMRSIAQQIADAAEQAIAQANQERDDVLILPRKFRKRDVSIPAIEISVSLAKLSQLSDPLEFRDELDTALAETRREILIDDPDIWRHLGKPGQALRELHGKGLLSDEATYDRVLRSAAIGEIALPTWRAYVAVSGEQALFSKPVDASAPERVYRINVALVNATLGLPKDERQRAQLEEHALFDCGFSVEVLTGELAPFEFQGTAKDYRYERTFDALGSNCIALGAADGRGRYLYTETVPLYEQPWYRTRNDLQVRFADLDDSPTANVFDVLDAISRRMDAFIGDWTDYLRTEAPRTLTDDQQTSCSRDRDNFIEEVQSFRLGVEALRRDTHLLRAFQLMNRVFRENGQQREPAITQWRLFQLAFMVIQIPTLAAREWDLARTDDYTAALHTAFDRVDVLWFPTGGGKTEAYLGLITTALFYDRLRGKSRGVSAWMRFPLRMLSLQQLDRLARVVARAEMIRSADPELLRQGGDPFSIGYYVGGNNTPNRIRETDIPRSGADKTWERQKTLQVCPFCGSEVSITFLRETWRLVHTCLNAECYTNTSPTLKHLGGSIPIFIVDNEIYRYRPSVLVGTVDKLAVLGFQKHFAHILSSVTQRCPLHGYLSFGQCIEGGSGGVCTAKLREYQTLGPEKDPVPSFLIQDELHLLKEELGTFNAHYEGFLSFIPRKQGKLPSKILAATATIEAYEAQTFHLYLKPARRFPQPSWREGESFYATSSPLAYHRLYAGVLTQQRSPEDAVLRTLALYHQEIQRMRVEPAATLAELGFMDVTVEQFLDFLHLYDLSVTYVNRKATGGNIVYRATQIVSPNLEQPLDMKLLTGDDTMTEVGQVISRIERERRDVDGTRLDALVATSLISHGVDLERINFLTMAGMPSRYAEYIQASSRAARNHVGLVVVCFKRGDLRERSQYHYFMPNHRYLDRLVEPVPINRFSAFATKRTVPGLLVGMLLSHYSRSLYEAKRIKKPFDNLRELHAAIQNGEVTDKQLNSDLNEIIGVDHPGIDQLQRRYLTEAIARELELNWDQIQRSLEARLGDAIHPMLSFRDVDETLDFIADGAASSFVDRIRNG